MDTAEISVTRVPVCRPRLVKSKFQHQEQDQHYESCSLSDKAETMNLIASVKLRPRQT